MKSSPWYSTETPEEGEPEVVYHDNLACKMGSEVAKNFRRYGTDNRPLCKRCIALNSEGK
jgi:hypothetical protein